MATMVFGQSVNPTGIASWQNAPGGPPIIQARQTSEWNDVNGLKRGRQPTTEFETDVNQQQLVSMTIRSRSMARHR